MLDLLLDGLFAVFPGGMAKLAAAALCILIAGGRTLARLIHLKPNEAGTELRAVGYIDAVLFPGEDFRPVRAIRFRPRRPLNRSIPTQGA